MELFRKNVAALIQIEDRYVGCLRADINVWQCVQGGVEKSDPSLEAALHRELHEELGVSFGTARIIKKSNVWRRYRFPKHFKKRDGMNHLGQEQMWFLVQLDSLSQVALGESQGEFATIRLMNLEELMGCYSSFKRHVFIDFIDELNVLKGFGK